MAWPAPNPGESNVEYLERAHRENWTERYGPYQQGLGAEAPEWQRMGFPDEASWAAIYRPQASPAPAPAPAAPLAPAAPPPQPEWTNQDENALARLRNLFRQYEVDEPDLQSWVRDLLIKDKTEDEIMLEFYDQPAVIRRFPGNQIRKQKGLTPLSPGQYLEYERTRRQILRAGNIPEGFYDSFEDAANDIGNDVALPELEWKVNEGYRRVNQSSPFIRQAFNQYFGTNGDAALAAWFMDKEAVQPVLERQIATAEAAGTAWRYGVNIGAGQASLLATMGYGVDRLDAGFRQISEMSPLFQESISETEDLTAESQGIETVFNAGGTGAEANKSLRKRVEERTAAFRGGGGSLVTERGFAGFGTAGRK